MNFQPFIIVDFDNMDTSENTSQQDQDLSSDTTLSPLRYQIEESGEEKRKQKLTPSKTDSHYNP